jgi:4-amino-4-deoxy-L-arabinose transferase-like glycosyltransferase
MKRRPKTFSGEISNFFRGSVLLFAGAAQPVFTAKRDFTFRRTRPAMNISRILVTGIFIGLISLALVTYFAGLSIDVTRDAGKYATIAKEAFQNNNYINLTVHGEPYDQKPPLLFWLGAIGFAIGGVSNFWFKLPVLLLVFFGFYSAYRLGKTLYNKRVGQITAFLLAFSMIYTLYTMDVHTDTPLQAFVTFALWQFAEFVRSKKNRHWILAFLGTGLAMLCKGPIGAAIPAFAVVGHLLLTKNFKSFLDYRWFVGIILSFLVVSPALIGLMNQFGWEGIRFFFWENNIGRITGSYVSTRNDPVFYVHSLLYLFLPWCLMFFISAFFEFRKLARNKFRTREYFTFFGIWVIFIILNASAGQLPNYIFSVVPLMAVLAAKWADKALRKKKKLFRIFNSVQVTIVCLLWITIAALAFYFFPRPDWPFWLVSLFGGLAICFIFFRSDEPAAKLFLPSAISFICLAFLLNTFVFPYMFSFQAVPKAARYFNRHAQPGDRLYNYHYSQYELFFYSEPQAAQIYTTEEIKVVAGKSGTWIFTDEEGFKQIANLNLKSDTVLTYQHLYLNRGAKFINPKTREKVLKPMYLIKY